MVFAQEKAAVGGLFEGELVVATPTCKDRGQAPSSKLRAALFTACKQRAEHASNIWLVYSARNDRQWILRSDAEYLHFLYLEFSEHVVNFQIEPEAVLLAIDGERHRTQFDALVRFDDGHIECREVKRTFDPPVNLLGEVDPRYALQHDLQVKAASHMGAHYVRICTADLEPHTQRIINSMRMLRFLSAARRMPLGDSKNGVLARLIGSNNGVPLVELMALPEIGHSALVSAAVFSLYQQKKVHLDIDSAPISERTLVRARK